MQKPEVPALGRHAHTEQPPAQGRANPLASDATALEFSSYLGPRDGQLCNLIRPEKAPSAREKRAHAMLRAKVLDESFPCVGARSVVNRDAYRLGVYARLGSRTSALALCHDLYEFTREFACIDGPLASFIAVFSSPQVESEHHYEALFWQHLQHMHMVDANHFAWSRDVGDDPDDPHFSFSIGERPYFLVGLHPKASRLARQLPMAAIVFNLHEQFQLLRNRNMYGPMKRAIRQRDLALQGTLNPMLTDFGQQSEARQYSGCALSDNWSCPLSINSARRGP